MRRIAALVFAFTLLASLPARADAQSWAEPASSLNQTEAAGQPFDGERLGRNVDGPVIADVGGVLHAAWAEWDGQNFEVRVARLEGNEWVALGDGCSPVNVDASRNAADVDLADHGGRPLVAWVEDDANGVAQVQAARFEDGAWQRPWGALTNEPPPNSGDVVNDSLDTQVAVVDGRPHLGSRIVRPIPYVNQVHRLRTDETAFEKIAPPDPTADSFGFEIHTDGDELYAFSQDTAFGSLWHFDGQEWDELPAPHQHWTFDEMTVHDGQPYVLFPDGATKVSRFDGTSWVAVAELGGSGLGTIASLAFAGGDLHLARIANGQIFVDRLAASGFFASLGFYVNQSDSRHEDDPEPTDTDLIDFGGRPYVAWAGWSGQIWKARVAGWLDAPPASVPAREQLTGCAAPPPPDTGGDGTGGGGGTGGTTAPPGATPPPAEPPRGTEPSISPRSGRLVLLNPRNRARRGIVRLRVRCAGGARCRGTAIARARSRIRGMEVGRVRVNLAAGEVATIRLRLTPRAIRMLRRGPVRYALTLRTPV